MVVAFNFQRMSHISRQSSCRFDIFFFLHFVCTRSLSAVKDMSTGTHTEAGCTRSEASGEFWTARYLACREWICSLITLLLVRRRKKILMLRRWKGMVNGFHCHRRWMMAFWESLFQNIWSSFHAFEVLMRKMQLRKRSWNRGNKPSYITLD